MSVYHTYVSYSRLFNFLTQSIQCSIKDYKQFYFSCVIGDTDVFGTLKQLLQLLYLQSSLVQTGNSLAINCTAKLHISMSSVNVLPQADKKISKAYF
jgi:hypothetical protein